MGGSEIEIFSPAKVNLFLGVIGERGDGYHEIVSLVGKLDFGDVLRIGLGEAGSGEGDADLVICEDSRVPVGGDNLIIKAVRGFRRRYAFGNRVRVVLDKRIPMGAGLGGGSSNAVAVLKGLNELLGGVLGEKELREIAWEVGSDCALFLEDGVVFVRGRGEVVEPVVGVWEKLRGMRLLVFKPGFSVDTGWAYGKLQELGKYVRREEIAGVVESWRGFGDSVDLREMGILYNSFEDVVFNEYRELGELVSGLRKDGVKCLMSGSGSACFCVLEEGVGVGDLGWLKECVREKLGGEIFMVEARLL